MGGSARWTSCVFFCTRGLDPKEYFDWDANAKPWLDRHNGECANKVLELVKALYDATDVGFGSRNGIAL
jgi:hypothetical protein